MSKVNTDAVNEFTNLPTDWRAMTIAAAREFRGPNVDAQTGERTRLVAITYRDKETGAEVIQNYSLDKPTYLAGVLEAALPGQSDELLSQIDWEVEADTQEIMGLDVLCKVYQDEFPLGSGLFRNKIGRVENINVRISPDGRPESDDHGPNSGTRIGNQPRVASIAGGSDTEDETEQDS